MSDFPTTIYTPRDTENLPGIVYDPADKKNMFSEDFQNLGGEINAIETVLGTTPQGAYSTVKAWLTALASAIVPLVWGNITGTLADQDDLQDALDLKQDALGFTPEDVANKSTNTSLGTSDSLYPSQKAVKTYVDAHAGGGAYDAVFTSRATNAGTGTQDISHGLGVVPKLVRITAVRGNASSTSTSMSVGSALSTSVRSLVITAKGSTTASVNGRSDAVVQSIDPAVGGNAFADITVIDSAKIRLNFTTFNDVSSDLYLQCEFFA